jgi:hypothetical protein
MAEVRETPLKIIFLRKIRKTKIEKQQRGDEEMDMEHYVFWIGRSESIKIAAVSLPRFL